MGWPAMADLDSARLSEQLVSFVCVKNVIFLAFGLVSFDEVVDDVG